MSLPISTSVIATLLQPTVSDLRARMDSVSREAVTGRYSDLTLHLEGRIGKAMLGQKALNDLSLQKQSLNLRSTRLDTVQAQLQLVRTASAGIGVDLASAVSEGDQNSITLQAKAAESALTQIFTSLNVQAGERYLFSGDATSTPPLGSPQQLIGDISDIIVNATDQADAEAQIQAYFEDPAGGWKQSIYLGTPTSSDSDAITAIDPALTELISGLAVAANASAAQGNPALGNGKALLGQAANTILSGQTSIIQRQGDLGLIQERLQLQQSSLEVEETILTQAFNDMTVRDQYEAATELSLLETNLEAAYMLTARISNLSLLNYLR